MHVLTVFPHFVTRLFLEFSFDHVLEFHSIHSKLSDSLSQLFRCHLILFEHLSTMSDIVEAINPKRRENEERERVSNYIEIT